MVACAATLSWTLLWNYQGEDRYVRIHDGLNSNVTLLTLTADPKNLLAPSSTKIEQMANIPRHCSVRGLYFVTWLFRFFPTIVAYGIAEALIRLAAVIGAFLLVSDFFWPPGDESRPWRLPLIAGLACCFAWLPFWIPGGLDVAGHPLLLWALLSLGVRRNVIGAFAVAAIYPFCTSLVLSGLFVLAVIGVGLIIFGVRFRKLPWLVVVAWVVLSVGWLATSYRLFEGRYADPDFVSMRSEPARSNNFAETSTARKHGYSLVVARWEANRAFFSGDDSHAPPKHAPVIFIAVILALAVWLVPLGWRELLLLRRQTNTYRGVAETRHEEERINDANRLVAPGVYMLLAVGGCVATSIWLGYYRTPLVGSLIHATGVRLLSEFNLARFHWFQPLLWFTAFTLAIQILVRLGHWFSTLVLPVLACLLVVGQLAHVSWQSEYLKERHASGVTFREFYSPTVFADIKAAIGREPATYRTASVGLHPSIALQNGFYTVDGYLANYALEHKQAIRQVIEPELEKNQQLKEQFDWWGARFYIFSAELATSNDAERASGSRFMYFKNDKLRRIEKFEIRIDALRELGAEYIFSAVEIGNAEALGLKHIGDFTAADSPWKISVYKIPDS